MSLGGQYGQFSHAPPIDYAPLCDTGPSSSTVRLIPFRCLGVSNALIVSGPIILADYESFLPAPIVTSGVSLPDPLLRSGIKDQLAENIHEVWAKNKVEAGFTYAEVCVCVCECVCVCVRVCVCGVCVWSFVVWVLSID